MGCSSSKIDDEDTVRLMKIRKRHIKDAVFHRNRFAAAHSLYISSLKDTGSALGQFGDTDIKLDVQPATPAHASQSIFQHPLLPPPPLPPPENQPSSLPLSRAASMPSIVLRSNIQSRSSRPSTLIEEEELDTLPEDSRHSVPSSSSKPLDEMVDHIFGNGGTGSAVSDIDEVEYETHGSRATESESDEVSRGRGEKLHYTTPRDNSKKRMEESSSSSAQNDNGRKQTLPESSQKTSSGSKDLVKILKNIDEYFLASYEAGKRVSRLLEAHKTHYHTSDSDDRSGMQEHHKKVIRILTLGKTPEDTLDGEAINGGSESDSCSLASTLDKLYAWEKKLYGEVKAGEATRIELEKRSAQLKSQKERGVPQSKIEQTMEFVKALQSKYLVEFQAVDLATQEVEELRDKHLYQRLLELVGGLKEMWGNMFTCHHSQLVLVTELMNLKVLAAGSRTSGFHRHITIDLEKEISLMRERLETMVITQHDWINALYEWLSQNLRPVESEGLSSPLPFPPIYNLCKSWVDALKTITSESAVAHLDEFSRILKELIARQLDENKVKEDVENASKDLEKKTKALTTFLAKYNERLSRMKVPQENEDHVLSSVVAERQSIIDIIQMRLKEENERLAKLSEENSSKITACLREGLPPVIQAMTNFSSKCANAYAGLYREVARGVR